MKWWNRNTKSFGLLMTALIIGLGIVGGVSSHFFGDCNIGHPTKVAQAAPVPEKPREYVARVMGYPVVVNSGNTFYTVYIPELGRVELVDTKCPQLDNGKLIVITEHRRQIMIYKYLRDAR